MGTCGSSLFGKGNQFIKINSGDFIAVDGSSVTEKLVASDLRMPYKQILKGRIILKAGQVNYLLNHLGMGDNATFLAIKAVYDKKSAIEEDNYISYSYYDYPVQNHSFAQMLVLTGNSTNRIPQLYLNNPNSKYPVALDVMVGLIDDSYSFFHDDISQTGTSFTGIEYTDIKSFVVGESIVVYDKNTPKRALIYLSLSAINSISLNGVYLVIDDDSFGSVFLQFLTEYDAVQAHSLINYVMEHPNVDIDDVVLPDSFSPVIYFNATSGVGGDYISLNGATAGVPYSSASGSTFSTSIDLSLYGYGYGTLADPHIDKSTLKDLLIDYVEDGRDGIIEVSESNLIIVGASGPVESITAIGSYSIYFDISDLAQNGLDDVVVLLTII